MNYPYKHNECECANKYHCLFDFAAAAITDTSHFVPPLTDRLGTHGMWWARRVYG